MVMHMQWQERQVYATNLARTKLRLTLRRHTHTHSRRPEHSHLKDLVVRIYICNYDS